MTVTSVHKDPATRTMTLTAHYDAPPGKVWLLWADPRRLERWWGPPTHPATVVDHDLTPGGKVTYYVSGPDGDRHSGWWDVRAVDEPHALEFEMGDPAIPSLLVRVRIEGREEGGHGERFRGSSGRAREDERDQCDARIAVAPVRRVGGLERRVTRALRVARRHFAVRRWARRRRHGCRAPRRRRAARTRLELGHSVVVRARAVARTCERADDGREGGEAEDRCHAECPSSSAVQTVRIDAAATRTLGKRPARAAPSTPSKRRNA